MPDAGRSLYFAWRDLAATRERGMGMSPLTWREVEAWQNLMGLKLSPWEAETLRAMDQAALADRSQDSQDS